MDDATVSVAVVGSRTEAELIVGMLRSYGVGAVVAADFDRDGQLDVFAGARLLAGQYPLSPRSALLANVSMVLSPSRSSVLVASSDRRSAATGSGASAEAMSDPHTVPSSP